MEKNGFTLVELLAVLAILAVVIAIAVPSVMGVQESIKNSMLEEKASFIEEAATLYGQDVKGSVISSDKRYKNNYPCITIKTYELVNNEYLENDTGNYCNTTSDGHAGCVVDPSDDKNYLDLYDVVIYYKNKRIYSKVDTQKTGNLCS